MDTTNVTDLPSDIDDNPSEVLQNAAQSSDDDFHDVPFELEDEEMPLDDLAENNTDMEFFRSATKNLLNSLTDMGSDSSVDVGPADAPHSLLYGDDYMVTIKSRRFALAFLGYTQYRVEKHCNPDKFRLLASLKKPTANNHALLKKRKDTKQRDDTPSPTPNIAPDLLTTSEVKSSKKKRNKRNKKRKITAQPSHDEQGNARSLPTVATHCSVMVCR